MDVVKKFFVVVALIAFAIAIYLAVCIARSSFPYELMDLDDSGFVSPREVIRTLDLAVREEIVEGKVCAEIYMLKDGMPLKQICNDD